MKNFPPQTGIYVVKTKSGQSFDHWTDYPHVRLQISVGQPYHEGHKLQALVDWCIPRFEHVQICVNDSLQRFNHMFENDVDEMGAAEKSRKDGESWVRRNQNLWGGKTNVSVMRWDQWLGEEYRSARMKVDWLYASNPKFQGAINQNIMAIWDRRKKENEVRCFDEDFSRFFSLSRQYLLEEISVFSVMFEEQEAIDIYPGTTMFAATVFQGVQVDGAPSGLGKGHFCRVDFSKNKNYVPRSEPRFG